MDARRLVGVLPDKIAEVKVNTIHKTLAKLRIYTAHYLTGYHR